ncbi:hypothetical protein [Streptomyces sp. HD]|uniref:hypothetical protein n=1 Tax=Streptomyces sp. HD TaxID=3020892 RepID=UPI0023312DC5|nr:hypothetical protein [Streptomyces sp. HD]MDC0769625.1 hypothetical protein [Streptomyces sp. HD]
MLSEGCGVAASAAVGHDDSVVPARGLHDASGPHFNAAPPSEPTAHSAAATLDDAHRADHDPAALLSVLVEPTAASQTLRQQVEDLWAGIESYVAGGLTENAAKPSPYSNASKPWRPAH